MRTRPSSVLLCLVVLALLITNVGCSGSSGTGKGDGDKKPGDKTEQEKPKTGTVTGKVSFQGQPLGGGTVSFVTEDGTIATTPIDPDGNYQVKRVPVGEVLVAVETQSARPFPKPPKDTKQPAKDVKIPAKYADPKTSGITYRVIEGQQEFNIELK